MAARPPSGLLHLLLLLLATLAASQQFGGGQAWNAANFPNPTAGQFKECRMKMTANICDPDGVLDESTRYRLDHDLKQLEARTRQDMARTFCEKKGVTAAMAVAKKVQGGSTEAVRAMANDMLQRWTLDPQCQKAVVIVVSVDDAKFWVARDDKVPVYADDFTELFMKEKSNFQQRRYQQALTNILQGTWEKALSKQGSPRMPPGGGAGGGGMGGGGMGGGGVGPGGQPAGGGGKPGKTKGVGIPSWFWVALVCFIIPLLCCCCLCYCCCCKGKGGAAGGGVPAMGGGGGPMGPGGQMGGGMQGGGGGGGGRSGGGGMGNFLGSLGGVGAGHMIGRLLGGGGRRGNDGGGVPAAGGPGYGGGYTPGQPGFGMGGGGAQPTYDDNGGQGGGGLYPSRAVKDQGGGGSWA